VNGFLFPFEDYGALADLVDQLLSCPSRHERMAAAALSTARERFSLESMIDKTLQVYNDVVAGRSSHHRVG
jgi:glycosyltransferase involved in cell wall biosynthesis